MQENRHMHRREVDRQKFEQCPKYEKHDLTDDQMDKLIDKAIERIDARSNKQLADFVKKEGTNLALKIVFALGALAIWASGWLQTKGFKFF